MCSALAELELVVIVEWDRPVQQYYVRWDDTYIVPRDIFEFHQDTSMIHITPAAPGFSALAVDNWGALYSGEVVS